MSSEYFHKQSNDDRLLPYDSQISLSLTDTIDKANGSSQDYHSISTSSTIITIETLNKENIRIPLSFKNQLFNNKNINQQQEHIHSDFI
ncbi:unnamed protein product [Rotaria sp. Silwood2]|nr:unnamed protein product [Rotaria sp. Silwood2]CAF2520909.1 unnamed protein product [Rotaria sp. Silwood2]CAF2725165.1 unnamed protein product [Rotaria sp. Silwood2]CAF3109766.1 unnamed protein product [Rotaria sp. Silwood2]CAF4116444.1 unnamed protein product [Rotaria sp. Silwood2]